MTAKNSGPASAFAGLAARLLEEAGETATDTAFDAAGFVAVYRRAIEALEARVARGDGHPPMTAREVALLCRCVLSCTDLEEAIRCAADFCALLHPRAGELALRVDGGVAQFRMDSLRRRPGPATCLVDITGLYSYLQLFGWLVGEPLRPRAVLLGYPQRREAEPFIGLFNAPVYVGGRCHGFEFDAALLRRPILRRPAELPAFLDAFPYDVLGSAAGAPPLRDRVKVCLEAALEQGQPLPEPAALAQLLEASAATLRRRLRAEGTSYSALREDCVRSAAERYLRDTAWDIETIAARLGFSDAGAFRRAFKRWTGHAPSELRRTASQT